MIEKILILFYFIKARWFTRKYSQRLYNEQMKFIRTHSPFYADKADIPIIDKKIMMEKFNEINTVGIDKDEALAFAIECEKTREFGKKLHGVTIGLSSGTSGHRGVFVVSDKERALWAGTILAKALPKGKIFGNRIAFFMRANSELYETVHSNIIKFKFFDMYGDMANNISQLQEFNPTILIAPPSMLLEISKHSPNIRPIKVVSIAEILEENDSEIIKKAFGVSVVHQVYQCTEGFLGLTCECGTLHLNEDFIVIEKEWIDEHRFYPIITDLKRRSQPMIRYRLNDILVEKSEPCKCGSKFLALEKIEGRQDDVFEFEGESGEKVKIFPDFIRRCVLFVDNIGEYRVRQIAVDKVEILIDDIDENRKGAIVAEFEKLSNHFKFKLPQITFANYEYSRNRKLKRVEKILW
ncbi:MAG: adenylate synthase [Campylobacteraceae bacterium]|jgi:putative adenylate-forming enzyme|nr:adenylate synthase [Campylobacteraceae bacterium]